MKLQFINHLAASFAIFPILLVTVWYVSSKLTFLYNETEVNFCFTLAGILTLIFSLDSLTWCTEYFSHFCLVSSIWLLKKQTKLIFLVIRFQHYLENFHDNCFLFAVNWFSTRQTFPFSIHHALWMYFIFPARTHFNCSFINTLTCRRRVRTRSYELQTSFISRYN